MATRKKTVDTQGDALVRVLVDCAYGKTDDVVELTPEHLAEAVATGQVDPNPEAVAYAQSLGV